MGRRSRVWKRMGEGLKSSFRWYLMTCLGARSRRGHRICGSRRERRAYTLVLTGFLAIFMDPTDYSMGIDMAQDANKRITSGPTTRVQTKKKAENNQGAMTRCKMKYVK
ncbi:hypothetical protein KFK09_024145 [Dendrobium nobile]|uniref:Uncharacterized protein n=1 Tax=Dendrobium nobile TaxID=94219 RepID=A0A8T3ADA3_DENNO|nr:hypothetical protein KFK09_024145 [Dendrobium nobile]